MSLIARLLGRKASKLTSAKISVLGPSRSGKTTLIRYLETGMPQLEVPLSTLGVEMRQKGVEIANWRFNLIDVGGQKVIQQVFWELAIEQAQAIIYVVDSTVRPEMDSNIYKEQRNQFIYAMDLIPEDSILLILLNKQDLEKENPINSEEFAKYYPMEKLLARTVAFLPSSAKFGNGIEEAMLWFIDSLERQKIFN